MSASSLDLRPLYYFVQVATAGSFSRASASLSVSQPLLSRFIRRLEDSVGVQLLHRHGRGVGLTEAGERLHGHAVDLLQGLSQAHLEVAALRGVAMGAVSVAVPPLLGGAICAEVIRRIRAQHPLVALTFREGFAAEALDWLGSGAVDIGVMFNPPHVATLITQPVVEDCIHLVGTPGSLPAPPGAPVAARSLADLDMILPPIPHRLRTLIEAAAHEAGVCLNVVVEVSGTGTVLELVRRRIGYTVLPSALLQDEIAEGRLVSWPIVDPVISTRLFLATSMQRPQTLASKTVLKHLADVVGDVLGSAEARAPPVKTLGPGGGPPQSRQSQRRTR